MQVTETPPRVSSANSMWSFRPTELDARVNVKLDDLKDRVQLRGFRPGKVPVAHLKRVYGRSAMAEVIEAAVREANTKIVSERGLRPAIEPKVVLPEEQAAVEGIFNGNADLAYTVEIEIVPPITLADFKTIKLTRLTAEATDAEIDQAIQTHRGSEPALRSQGRRRGKRRSRHHLVREHDRRRAVRGRQGRECSAGARIGPVHSRIRGAPPGHRGRRRQDLRHQIPRRLPRQGRGGQKRDLRRHRECRGGARRRHRR